MKEYTKAEKAIAPLLETIKALLVQAYLSGKIDSLTGNLKTNKKEK